MSKPARAPQAPSSSNFIRQAIEADLASAKYAAVRTRFPPEPNGYLHFGHAKSICLNFGLAQHYGGACNLRFDDTNPAKEEQEYVDSIKEMVTWLGYEWPGGALYASDYFPRLYGFAQELVRRGHAYVDSQSGDEMRESRGSLTSPGRNSPFRGRSVEENLRLLASMKEGAYADGAHVLRAKIDMASPNINLRDPVMYRIRHAAHHRTGSDWRIYPTYDWAHGVSDAIEGISHSLCTLEFEDHRPLYEWFNERLAEAGFFDARRLPKQIEFARLNLTYVALSKRKLIELVEGGHVEGWDDPRMPTLAGARRRGYPPEGFRLFAERIGVSKAHQLIEFSTLEDCMREHLNAVAPRRMAALDPVKLVIDNYPEGQEELCEVPNHPQKPEWGRRQVPFSRELWIEREDFQAQPPKGYFRLFPGNEVRLRYGYVVKCLGLRDGAVHCTYHPDSRSGTPGADRYKVKGNIHWVSVKHAHAAEVRLYDRLFRVPEPEGPADLNPDSMKTRIAQLEPSLRPGSPGNALGENPSGSIPSVFQFERHGYFVADRRNPAVFNRTVSLRDSWAAPPR
ncbi:MAG TPA: glutamine--tRNA ligase/YqeY domain fusion protein [Burkholderiales bacterium]|nr:glutamine--tRNA ligase/YqeY domain fusion protein [Burkholderiales bacterium]